MRFIDSSKMLSLNKRIYEYYNWCYDGKFLVYDLMVHYRMGITNVSLCLLVWKKHPFLWEEETPKRFARLGWLDVIHTLETYFGCWDTNVNIYENRATFYYHLQHLRESEQRELRNGYEDWMVYPGWKDRE